MWLTLDTPQYNYFWFTSTYESNFLNAIFSLLSFQLFKMWSMEHKSDPRGGAADQ